MICGTCPNCNGDLLESSNEHGVLCDSCNYPYSEEVKE